MWPFLRVVCNSIHMTWKVTNSLYFKLTETLGVEYVQAGVLQCLKWGCDRVLKASHLFQSQEADKLPQMKKKPHQVKGNWFKSSPKHRGLLLIQRSKLWGWLEESSLLSTLDPGPRHQDMYSRKTLIFKGQKISEHFLFLKFVLSLFISKYFKAYLCVWLTSTIQLLMT